MRRAETEAQRSFSVFPLWLEVNVSDRSRNQNFWRRELAPPKAYLKFETFADIFAVKFKLTEMVRS